MAKVVKTDGKWVIYGLSSEDKTACKEALVKDEAAIVQFVEVNNGGTVHEENDGVWYEQETGGGTSDYSDLENKPSINGVTLDGGLSLETLGITCDAIGAMEEPGNTASGYAVLTSTGGSSSWEDSSTFLVDHSSDISQIAIDGIMTTYKVSQTGEVARTFESLIQYMMLAAIQNNKTYVRISDVQNALGPLINQFIQGIVTSKGLAGGVIYGLEYPYAENASSILNATALQTSIVDQDVDALATYDLGVRKVSGNYYSVSLTAEVIVDLAENSLAYLGCKVVPLDTMDIPFPID